MPNNKVKIHGDYFFAEGKNKDIPEVKSIFFEVLAEYGLKPDESSTDADLNDIEAKYQNNNGYFGLLIFKDIIIGTFGLYKLTDEICELRKMYLKKEHRGQGLGKFVVNYIIDLAKEKGYKIIELETASVLKEAIGLYERYGFKEVKREHLAHRCDKAYILELN